MPAPLDPNPPLFPPEWACAYGEDRHGLWAAFEIGRVQQTMRWILPGRFEMGSPKDESGRFENEVRHTVTLTRGYWLGDTAVTQALWQVVMGENPSHFKDDPQNPVEQVSWEDCERFMQQVSEMLPGGLQLRLPSEAEWEYACCAGSKTAFSWGDELTADRANYDGNFPYNSGPKGEYRNRTVPVRSFQPNPWGLYQMHGNVWEWVADWSGDYPAEPVADPEGPASGRERILRGGGWDSLGRNLRPARRNARGPGLRSLDVGFRPVLPAEKKHSPQAESLPR